MLHCLCIIGRGFGKLLEGRYGCCLSVYDVLSNGTCDLKVIQQSCNNKARQQFQLHFLNASLSLLHAASDRKIKLSLLHLIAMMRG